MDKRKFWGSILGTTMFLVMLLGLTYAYYTWRSSDTSLTFSISDAYFKCQSGIETHTTSLEPVNDYKLGSYQTFDVNNVGMTDTTFSLTMDIESIDEELIAEDVKYKLVVDETGGSNDCTTTDCTSVGEGSFANAEVGMNTLVATIFIPNNVNYKYYLFIYIDGEMSENTNRAGKSINGTLEVCEIVVFLDYQGGNSTQSFLKVTDTYEDLPTSATKNNFTISYEENGGTSVADGTITYTFDGWYTEPNGGGNLIIPTTEVSKTTNHTLYAKWSNTCVSLPSIAKTGYTFNGWYSDSSLTKKVGGAGDNYCEATDKLYAGWTANQYGVTFDSNGGTLVPGNVGTSKTVTYNSTYGELPSSTREGYVFGGWNTKVDGTGITIDSTSKVTTASNHTLYANWNVVNYTLTLYDGQEQIDEYQVASNVDFQLPRFSIIPNDANNSTWGDFIGWSTDENGTMITYEDASSLGYLTSNLELYAVFGRDIIFKYGENASESFTSTTKQLWNPNNETGTSIQSPSIPNILICEDGTTSGCSNTTAISIWFATGFRNDTIPGSAEYEQSSSISPGISETSILYAVYQRHLYFISGIEENASYLDPITQFLNSSNNSVSTISGLSMEQIPYWQNLGYRDDTLPASYEYSCAYAKNFTCKPEYNSGDEFYGVYSRKLTVTYNGNGNTGGTAPSNNSTSIYLNSSSPTTSSQEVTLAQNRYTKTGYDFSKWAVMSVDGIQYDANSNYNPNLSYDAINFEFNVYAIWTLKKHIITYHIDSNSTIGTQTFEYGVPGTIKSWDLSDEIASNYEGLGWKFEGWSTSAEDLTVEYYEGDNITLTSNIELYAILSRYVVFRYADNNLNPQETIEIHFFNPCSSEPLTSNIELPDISEESIGAWEPGGWGESLSGYENEGDLSENLISKYNVVGSKIIQIDIDNDGILETKECAVLYYFYWRRIECKTGGRTPNLYDQYMNSYNSEVTQVVLNPDTLSQVRPVVGYRADAKHDAPEYPKGYSVKANDPALYYYIYQKELIVTYHGNGATGGNTENTIKPIYTNAVDIMGLSDQTIELAQNDFIKDGYTFVAWAEGSVDGSQYAEGESYNPNLTLDGDLTVNMYAIWERKINTINLNPILNVSNSNYSTYICQRYGDGIYLSCNFSDSYLMSIDSNPIIIPTASNGNIFKGYYTAESGGVQLIDSNGYITSNFTPTYFIESATLYAQWDLPPYNITYYNGSTKLDVSTCKRGENITLKTFEELGGTVTNSTYGWSFGHWANGENTYAQTYTDGQTISCPSNDISLYSVYSRVITFKSGVSASTTSTATQYWNPYGTTALTHLSAVKAPVLDAITNWTALGYRRDNATGKATYAVTTTPRDIAPSPALTVTFNAVYERTLTFYSGVNGETTDGTRTQYLNVNNNTLSSITTFTPASITNWTTLGYRTDTVAGTQSCDQATTCSLSYDSGNALYAVYKRTLTFHSGANASKLDYTQVQYLNSYDNTVSSVKTNDSYNYEINGKITSWIHVGYRTDTIPGMQTDSCFPSSDDCAPPYSSGNDLYAVFHTNLVISYKGNGNTGGTIPPSTTKMIYLNAASTTTSSQEVTLESNTFTKENQTFVAWAAGSPTGTQYGAESTYNPNIPYDSDSFNVTMYAVWRDNQVIFNFDVNGGYLDVSSIIYPGTGGLNEYKVGEDGLVYIRVDESIYGVEWGKNFNSVSYNYGLFNLYDYDDGVYSFSIANYGLDAQKGAEWICTAGCTVTNKKFNQANNYYPSDFCDTTESDCTVVLAVNWNKLVPATIGTQIIDFHTWIEPRYFYSEMGITYYPENGSSIFHEMSSTEFSTIYAQKKLNGSIAKNKVVYVEKNDNNELLGTISADSASGKWQKIWIKDADISDNLTNYQIQGKTIGGELYYPIYYYYYSSNSLTNIGNVSN